MEAGDGARTPSIAAVVFDLDGVIVDTEQVWDDVRERLAREGGGLWHDLAQADMMGMSSPEWSRYMHDVIGLPGSPAEINAEVVERMLVRYRESLPLIEGAVAAVRRLAARFPLAVASSSNRPLIETVLAGAGIADLFAVTVSSEEVDSGEACSRRLPRGNPAPRSPAVPLSRSRTQRTGSARRTRLGYESAPCRTRTILLPPPSLRSPTSYSHPSTTSRSRPCPERTRPSWTMSRATDLLPTASTLIGKCGPMGDEIGPRVC